MRGLHLHDLPIRSDEIQERRSAATVPSNCRLMARARVVDTYILPMSGRARADTTLRSKGDAARYGLRATRATVRGTKGTSRPRCLLRYFALWVRRSAFNVAFGAFSLPLLGLFTMLFANWVRVA